MSETLDPNSNEQSEPLVKSVPPVMPPQVVPPPPMNEYPRAVYQQTPQSDDTMKYLIPVNPSIWAVVAGYVGMFSVLAIPAPFAIIFGIVALKDLKKNPTKSGSLRAWFAIGIGSFFVIFYLIVVFMTLNEPKRS